MQAVRSYQEAMPMAGFLSSVRQFSFLRMCKSARARAEDRPVGNPWMWQGTGHDVHGLRYNFTAGAWACQLEISGPNAQLLVALAGQLVGEILRIEEKFAQHGAHSVIQALNCGAGRAAVVVDAETQHLLNLAHQQWQTSHGLVDATSGVVRYAWDNGRLDAPQNHNTLQHLMSCVGWQHVQRQLGWVRFDHPALEINLGSLHEAYAVDHAISLLAGMDGVRVSLSVGHARRVWAGAATRETGRAEPLKTSTLADLLHTWPAQVGGLVAKGFAVDGPPSHPLAHLGFNPHTGQPLQDWQQLVVQADTAVQADTLVKTALVKGQEAFAWLSLQQTPYFALRRDGKVFCTQLERALLASISKRASPI